MTIYVRFVKRFHKKNVPRRPAGERAALLYACDEQMSRYRLIAARVGRQIECLGVFGRVAQRQNGVRGVHGNERYADKL